MSQSHGTAIWQEPAGSGAVPTVAPIYFVKSGSKWVLSTSGTQQGRLLDVTGAGKAVLIDVSAEYQLVDTGSGVVAPNTVGAAAAVMTKVGSKYVAAAIAGSVQAARFFLDAVHGNLRLVPLDAPETLLVLVRGKARAY